MGRGVAGGALGGVDLAAERSTRQSAINRVLPRDTLGTEIENGKTELPPMTAASVDHLPFRADSFDVILSNLSPV